MVAYLTRFHYFLNDGLSRRPKWLFKLICVSLFIMIHVLLVISNAFKDEIYGDKEITQNFHRDLKPSTLYFRYEVRISYNEILFSGFFFHFAGLCSLHWKNNRQQTFDLFPQKQSPQNMVLKTQNLEMLKFIDTNHSINSDIIFEHCKHKFCASSHTKCKYVYETLYISSKWQFKNINVDEFFNQL